MQAGFLNPGGGQRRRRDQRPRREGRDALDVLPEWAWLLVLKQLDEYDHLAFGLTCRAFLEAVTTAANRSDHLQKEKQKTRLKTNLGRDTLFKQMPCFTLSWFQWVFRSFERKKGAPDDRKRSGDWRRSEDYYDHLYDYELMELAAFQGSKKVIKWLVSQGIPLKIKQKHCGMDAVVGAACGGHIELLEWLRSEGYGFDERTCSGAAQGGHLEVLQSLRSQDPPCPWNPEDCRREAKYYNHQHVIDWMVTAHF
ncbi:hypothetical protein HOP50_10g58020 [Chloropicon primus]|nr:hypothetical protein HOP50_10g58020 [Chloropicon primus]